eukprot:CAMPEP_0174315208 /NCGR_PEP_ID=MMETSP0810-20121108/6144_1 /TAXON_ID=73025 ORGANISM="Eutreptiella gymnastica-like, Strain CCMP1594" /NCGR_SAMPLE_ID=MMETSP0810 /ASSEMBLY_ACC=CAM_ASM_000659 /LENGTH=424 /DNA_ID=CAMNT_0015424539 /DNA_START=13 /DNA_END=1287 /DNA_ORIENTATION=-
MASRFVSSPEAQPFMKPHHVTVDCSAAAEAPSAPVRSALTLPLLAVAAAAAVLWGGVHWGGSPVASQLHTRPAATARTVRAARPSHTPSGLLRPVRAPLDPVGLSSSPAARTYGQPPAVSTLNANGAQQPAALPRLLWPLSFVALAIAAFGGRLLRQKPLEKSAEALPLDPLSMAWLSLPQMSLAMLSTTAMQTTEDASDLEGRPRCLVQLEFSKTLSDGERPLVDYVQLPAKKYSVLDSNQVQRIDDDTFRVNFGDLKVPGLLRISPTAEVSVEVPESGAIQTINSIGFEGKPAKLINAMNMLFSKMTWVNEVTAEPLGDGTSNLISNVKLDWYLPKGYPAKPELMNKLVTRLMNYMMPWLLNKLQDDYARWAAGDDTRAAVTRGEIAQLTADFMQQNQDLVMRPSEDLQKEADKKDAAKTKS